MRRPAWWLGLLLAWPGWAADGDRPGVVVLDAALTGQYIRRGQPLGPAGIVGSAYLRQRVTDQVDLQANVSSYLQLDGAQGLGESIYDLATSYRPSWFKAGAVTVGYTYYDRCNSVMRGFYQGDDTQEVYAGIDLTTWEFRPWLYVLYDFDRGEGRLNDQVGTYLNAGLSHTWQLGQDGWLDTSARLGLDLGRGVDVFSDLLVRTAIRWQLSEHLTAGPAVDWWFPSHQVNPGAHGFKPVLSAGFQYTKSY